MGAEDVTLMPVAASTVLTRMAAAVGVVEVDSVGSVVVVAEVRVDRSAVMHLAPQVELAPLPRCSSRNFSATVA